MSEEFLYGCGVIPRGQNRLITMSDSTDLDDSETIASSKAVSQNKKKMNSDLTELEQQVADLTDSLTQELNTKFTQLQNSIISLSQNLQNLKTQVSNIREGLPIGHIFFSMNVPTGCLVCEGQTISRTEYPDLWNYVSTNCSPIADSEWTDTAETTYTYCHKFSTGDGNTTYRLPKFASFIELNSNAEAGTFYKAGLPNITGYIGCPAEMRTPTGAFYTTGNGVTQGHEWSVQSAGIDASRCSSIYGNSTTVQPEAMVWLACIQAK